MKKLHCSIVSVLMIGMFSSINAADIDGVGVDWARSSMVVDFTPESTLSPALSCFGDVSCAQGAACTLTTDLASLGYSDTSVAPVIDDCFHEAGDYDVTILLEDFATNVADPVISNFTVRAGSPDSDASDLIPGAGCDFLVAPFPVANNSDTCTMQLVIRDAYGNPVTQIATASESVSVYTDSLFPMDANNPNGGALSFIQGLKVNAPGTTLATTSAGANDFAITNDLTSGAYLDLSFYSITPTLTKVGSALAKKEIISLDLVFTLPGVNADGSLDLANPVTFRFGDYSPDIYFEPMIQNDLRLGGGPQFIIDVDNFIDIQSLETKAGGMVQASSLTIGVVHHYLPWVLKFDPTIFMNDPGPTNMTPLAFGGLGTRSELVMVIVRLGMAAFTENLSFSSVIEYNFGGVAGPKISYPGAAMGSGFGADCDVTTGCDPADIAIKLIGASIEGEVLGGTDTTKLGSGTDESFLIGSNKFTDIREAIFKNAHNITRSLTAKAPASAMQPYVFAPGDYTGTDVVVVEGDVEIGKGGVSVQLPGGANTLVIKNGNLIISGDLTYNPAEKSDSFGFILINDKVEPFPQKGNLFIKNGVRKVSGTFFLEGGVMTNNTETGANEAAIYDSANAEIANDEQLVLEGSLLSHSTLGGGYVSLYASGDTDYMTPWGLISEVLIDPGYVRWTTAGRPPLEIAQAYDLHMVRYYRPEYDVGPIVQNNGDLCACQQGETCTAADPSFCDANDNAFVIRIDGRVKQSPPPGFQTLATIKW